MPREGPDRSLANVHSTRFPEEMSRMLEAEAERLGVTPSVLIREIVTDALHAVDADEAVMLNPTDLHRAINRVVRRARAA